LNIVIHDSGPGRRVHAAGDWEHPGQFAQTQGDEHHDDRQDQSRADGECSADEKHSSRKE
jgi:hypothetical protein